jgi:hypothetical protein
MATSMTGRQILDREYLEVRGKILELAAFFDRLERGNGAVPNDPRLGLIHEGLQVLLGTEDDRAEQVQLIFSRQYDKAWREKFGLAGVRKAK